MKAAIYYGKQDIRVEDITLREIGERDVKIQVKYCGVCGTDVHIFNGEGGAFEVNPPLIPGHEFSGVVSEVGSKVKTVKIGDRVCADPNDMCGECYFCRNANQHFCSDNRGVGTTEHGGFAEFVIMREKQVYKIPDQLSFVEAAMVEPMSCCLHGLDLCNIKAGDNVLVMGGGNIGIIMLQLAKNSGAAKVILSEPVETKRELALTLGADRVIDTINENVEDILAEYCENIDVVIECIGNVKTQADAIKFAGRGATIMYFGLANPDETVSIKPDDIFKKELKITSSFINPYTFDRAIQILSSGKINVDSIISSVVPLEDIQKVFTDPKYRKEGKVIVKI